MKIFLLIASAFWFYLFPAESKLVLQDLIRDKKITVNAVSKGGYSGEVVTLNLKNNGNQNLQILVPAGTLFISEDASEQELIVTNDHLLVLGPKRSKSIGIKAFCSEMHDLSPDDGQAFTISKTQRPELVKLCEGLNKKSFDDGSIQEAVWAVSDNESIASIYEDDIEKTKELREIVSAITGKPNPWYQKVVHRELTTERRITGTPQSVSGGITYTSTKGELISAALSGPGGLSVKLGQATAAPFTGKMTYNFKLTLEGYDPGTYTIRILAGTKIIKTETFEV